MNFNTIGIISEYNPFHFGHKYHIKKTRELTGCQNIVCIMSGSMVQRGECAILDKWQRASMAINSGADLVIELPCYYVLQSADIFAQGAVKILDATKVIDGISFGCECGDVNVLNEIANIVSEKDGLYNVYMKEFMSSGIGYPQASQQALKKIAPEYASLASKPNNTLGISYIKALKQLNSTLEPMCIKRNNDYHGDLSDDGFMSATSIRKMMHSGKDYSLYSENYVNLDMYDLKNAEVYILGFLRQLDFNKAKITKGYEEGLDNLVHQSAAKACSLDELFELCSGKRYTLHRIKRYIMSLILDINYSAEPNYIRVLAMNDNGKKLLKRIREDSEYDIVVKTADYKKSNKMFETDIKSTDFASLCSANHKLRYIGKDYKTSPFISK